MITTEKNPFEKFWSKVETAFEKHVKFSNTHLNSSDNATVKFNAISNEGNRIEREIQFHKKLGLDLTSKDSKGSSFYQVLYKFYTRLNDIIYFKTGNEDEDLKLVVAYLQLFPDFILKVKKENLVDYIDGLLKKEQIRFKNPQERAIINAITNIYFIKYLENENKNKPIILADIIKVLKSIDLTEKLSTALNVFKIYDGNLKKISTVSIYFEGESTPLVIKSDDIIEKRINEIILQFDPFINLLENLTNWDKKKCSQELYELIDNLILRTKKSKGIIQFMVMEIYNNLTQIASKTSASCFIHDCFTDIIPQLTTKENYEKIKKSPNPPNYEWRQFQTFEISTYLGI